jgi:hypothetical protein
MMLIFEELARLAAIADVVNHDKLTGQRFASNFSLETVEWLVTKLKETNNELGKTAEELQQAHQENGRLREVYE